MLLLLSIDRVPKGLTLSLSLVVQPVHFVTWFVICQMWEQIELFHLLMSSA